mmetsp:Transcript_28776/g.68214  ORF Transcript_28776/g.68214 Transcript_28776/m.68214 type:complete len:127 (-) Transcript_28776:103-483(-)
MAVLQSQLCVLGSATDEEHEVVGPRAKETFSGLSPQPGQGWKDVFADANLNPLALDLLRCMLSFDPRNRPTASEALDHLSLAELHDPHDNRSFNQVGASLPTCDTSSGEPQEESAASNNNKRAAKR